MVITMSGYQDNDQVPTKEYEDTQRELHEKLEEIRSHLDEARHYTNRCRTSPRAFKESAFSARPCRMIVLVSIFIINCQKIYDNFFTAVGGYLSGLRVTSTTPAPGQEGRHQLFRRLKERSSRKIEVCLKEFHDLLEQKRRDRIDFIALNNELDRLIRMAEILVTLRHSN